ncbi:GBP-domain-containing protein [Gigaspora margarita]|uniref:GBP-domain-containing protein n=1 Tax=Gigaspora margarita TaxID=4874 RepID=A0A8H4AJL7_GIGMA|nr:GBP-domain-containing protein [Gigaspora margarita]
MSPNPFSNNIPFRQGNPVHLLNYMCLDEGVAILLDEKALRILKEIHEPIAVITVVGSYRRGKSYFANALLGRHDGFKLGSSVNGCTKGIDIWDTPFYHKGKRVVIIDCEGIDDPNQELPWANKLFILCLAISSTLIYNINGIVGRDDIEKLFLMTKIVSLIQPPNDHQFLPNLVVLLRDFQLDSPPDFVKYFLNIISKTNEDAANELTKFFKKFNVYAIPHPGIRQDAMRNMNEIETDKLDPIFVEKVEESVTKIFEDLHPKYLNASTMSGVTFAEFLERCVAQINDPANTVLSIPSAYESTINYAAQKAYESSLELYNDMMDQMNFKGFPISWDEFKDVHNIAFEEALKNFIQQIIGNADQIQSFRKTFHDKITGLKDQFYMKNSTAMSKYHEEWAHKLWKEHVAPGLEMENLFDTDKFEEAIALFEQIYGTIVMPGQEAIQVLNEFKTNQYEDAIKLLNTYDVLREERANEMLARQAAEKKYYELLQEEEQLKTEINNFKIENEKIQNQLEEKVNSMEECLRNQEQQNGQVIDQLKNDNERMLNEQRAQTQRSIDQQTIEYERMLDQVKEENQSRINNLQDQLNHNNQRKSDFWETFAGIAGSIAGSLIAGLVIGLL